MITHSMETYEPTSLSIHCPDRPCLKISVCVGKNVECDLLLDSGEDYDEATELLQQAASGSQSYGGYGGYGGYGSEGTGPWDQTYTPPGG